MAKCSSKPSSVKTRFSAYPWYSELLSLDYVTESAMVTEVHAGAINTNYQVVNGSQQFFLKVFSDTDVMVDRSEQFRLLHWLNHHHLTPQNIYLSQSNHFQLDQWHPHQTPKNTTQGLEWLAVALATLHQLPVSTEYPDCPRLNLPSVWQQYIEASQLELTPSLEKRLKDGEDYWLGQKTEVLGHHDLHIQHILGRAPICIIDFEYAALSTPAFDLASTVKINNLATEQQKQLCAIYGAQINREAKKVYREMLDAMPWVNLTYELWQHLVKNR